MDRDLTLQDVDHIDVRLVRIPEPATLQVVVLDRLGPELAQRLANAVRAALRADCDQRPGGWSTLWMTHTHRFFEIGEYVEQVRLGCDGDDGGAHLAARVEQDAIVAGMPSVRLAGPAPAIDHWTAVAARWGRWVAGTRLGAVQAVLEPQGGLQAPELVPAPPLRLLSCPVCHNEVVPRRLVGPGMPVPDGTWELAVDGGEADLLGCGSHERHGTARCPGCGSDFVPAGEPVRRIVEAVLASSGARPLRPSRTIYECDGARAWLPSTSRSGGHWWFALRRSHAEALDAVPEAVVVLRLRGTTCLCIPWSSIRKVVLDSERERTHMHVLVSDPSAVRIAGLRILGAWDPSALPEAAL